MSNQQQPCFTVKVLKNKSDSVIANHCVMHIWTFTVL